MLKHRHLRNPAQKSLPFPEIEEKDEGAFSIRSEFSDATLSLDILTPWYKNKLETGFTRHQIYFIDLFARANALNMPGTAITLHDIRNADKIRPASETRGIKVNLSDNIKHQLSASAAFLVKAKVLDVSKNEDAVKAYKFRHPAFEEWYRFRVLKRVPQEEATRLRPRAYFTVGSSPSA